MPHIPRNIYFAGLTLFISLNVFIFWPQRAACRILVPCCYGSVTQPCLTLWDLMDCSTPGSPVLHRLSELVQTHAHWVSDAIQPSHPLSSPSPAFNLSQYQGVFSWTGSSHQVAKVFSLSTRCSNEYSELVSFRIDWFDLPAVQGTLMSLLWHHSSKGSVLWHSAFFRVQLSHPYMTTGKTIALTIWNFVFAF